MTQWVQEYYELNNSFKKRLVFRLGVEAGFFSEYNNMVLAMVYCLKNKIKFVLYSKFANFTVHDGWNDFFLPFESESESKFHKIFNKRYNTEKVSYSYPLRLIVKPRHIIKAYKQVTGIKYFTQDIWPLLRSRHWALERITIPELGFYNSDVLGVSKKLIQEFWKYNSEVEVIVQRFSDQVALPESYVSMHIRAGDKSTETKTYDYPEYIAVASKVSNTRDAFVLTDDYTIIEKLRADYPDWRFYTLTMPTERGYFQDEFDLKDGNVKYLHHLRFFAEIDIASKANNFIGTYSSNIGMHMGMRIGQEKCKCLDFPQWVFW